MRDLHAAGLLGMRVRLLRDKTEGLFAAAGSTGRIDTQQPVSLSNFDLRVQAPVMGLTEHDYQVLGVAWADLICK
jgi:spore maturation protein SpmB